MEVETRPDIPVSWAEKAGWVRWVCPDPESSRHELGRSVVGQIPAADPEQSPWSSPVEKVLRTVESLWRCLQKASGGTRQGSWYWDPARNSLTARTFIFGWTVANILTAGVVALRWG